ncbi:uncharacterized protein NPIL_108981 [Nephila pilipes]|uniref:Kinetochore protein Spc24 n=1 Tax=Nephila pilipes TaxID=299642 RepID=A0A8X6MQ48_NEPPI|nr:uncharacterized protein NPIL_108981 [Nephila pilipes]
MTETRNNQVFLTEPEEKPTWKNRCIDLLKKVEKNPSTKVVKGKINNLLKEKEAQEEKLKFIEDEIKDVMKELNEMNTGNENKPLNSNILKLYQLITKITFAIESSPTDLQGYVAGNSLETFHFDTTKQSKQFIIDHLWQLMDSQLELGKE